MANMVKRAFTNRTTVWLPIMILLPLAVAGFALDRLATEELQNKIRSQLLLAAHSYGQQVVALLQTKERLVQGFANETAGALARGATPKLDRALILSRLPEAMACALFDRQGRVLTHTEAPGPLPIGMDRNLPGTPTFTITDPASDSSGQFFYDLFLPVSAPEEVPATGQRKAWVGTVGCRFRSLLSESLTKQREGLESSGEVYLVNAKTQLMLTESRFLPGAAGRTKVETLGIRETIQGRGGVVLVYPDYRGTPVMGAGLSLPAYGWILLAEIDEAEALAPLARLRFTGGLTLLLVSLGGGGMGWWYSRRLIRVSQAIREAVEAMLATSTQITSMLAQQDQAAALQASAATETSTTMVELGASAKQSANQADAAATTSRQLQTLAEDGTSRVQRMLNEMMSLREKVESVAKQILSLSEQATQIGSLAKLVGELAGETNMLALNAAVEAARAGESGKGFAVVASEIRRLADQSKKSAERANLLVADIQKATNATVMATEQGTKSVEAGTLMMQQTGEAFTALAVAVAQIFQNAQQVSLNGQQQAAAINQVSAAMNNLNAGVKQVADGITHVRSDVQRLDETARKLETIV